MTKISYPKDMRERAKQDGARRLITLDIRGVTGRGGLMFQSPATIEEAEWWVDRFCEFQNKFRKE